MGFTTTISAVADIAPDAPEVTFDAPGTYDIVLSVVNEAGAIALATSTVTITTAALPAGTTRTWNAAGSGAAASEGGNWLPSGAPADGDSVVFDGTSVADCTWDLAVTLAAWQQTAAYSGAVTFLTRYPGAGDFTRLVVTGDVTVAGGAWTHPVNNETDPYGLADYCESSRLALTIGGDFTLGPGASVDVSGKGFAANIGPGAGFNGSQAESYPASHGGRGAVCRPGSSTYGSATMPLSPGSGATGPGGGAIWLRVGGHASLDGTTIIVR